MQTVLASLRSWKRDRKPPTPSTERMVADSSTSVIDWRAWTTHSHPARVLRAYWKRCSGNLPSFGKLLCQCSCHQPSERHSRQSHVLTPMVSSELSCVPNAIAGSTDSGTSARAKNPATSHIVSNVWVDSKRGNKCSASAFFEFLYHINDLKLLECTVESPNWVYWVAWTSGSASS